MSDPSGPDPFIITVGATSFNVRYGRVTTTINEPDTASGTVSADDMARSPTDWRGPAQASVGSDVLSSGQVIEALPKGDGSVALLLRSGVELSESLMPPMVCQNLTPQEIVYAAARSAGFATTHIHIHGLNDLPVEPMWVLAPVDGDRTMRVGMVEFMDAEAGQEMLRRFSPPLDPAFAEPLAGASAFARVAVAASLPYEAEQEAWRLSTLRRRG